MTTPATRETPAELLARTDLTEVIRGYGVDLKKRGRDFVACCPFHAENTPSFTVTPIKQAWYCFGCGAGGDALTFVREFTGCTFGEALDALGARQTLAANPAQRPSTRPADEPPEWVRTPAPSNPPDPPATLRVMRSGEWVEAPVVARWAYRDAAGELVGYTCRVEFDRPDGTRAKDVIPLTWQVNTRTGECRWRMGAFEQPRPLYGAGLLAANPGAPVIVVEGEKPADAGRRLFPGRIVVTWPGGCKAVSRADWSMLSGRKVAGLADVDAKTDRDGALLPRHQQPGTVAMLAIAEKVRALGGEMRIWSPAPGSVADGWDIADAEAAGMDGAELLARIRTELEEPEQLMPTDPPAPEPAPEDSAAPPPAPKPKRQRQRPQHTPTADEPIRALGYDRGRYYYMAHRQRQVHEYSKSDHTSTGLLQLAPLSYWEQAWASGGEMKRETWTAAVDALMRQCERAGIFDPAILRGRGCWEDEGRVVFNLGNRAIVDGVPMPIDQVPTRYIYEAGPRLTGPADEPLPVDQARRVIEIAKRFNWEMPGSAALLAGWIVLAPVCGALRWRPHVWITGGTGTGKAQPHSAGVLTISGWRTMGEVMPGDYVRTPDNGYGRVLWKFPQGVKPVYRLTFSDGRSTRATGDHLWKVRVKGEWRIRTTDQMIEVLARNTQASDRIAVPAPAAMTIKSKDHCTALPLHPYVLGIMLGDGHMGSEQGACSLNLTCFDPEIVERARIVAQKNGVNLFDTCVPGRYRFGDLSRYGRSARKVIKDLRLLGTRSGNKFIPSEYLEASIEDRIELLRGLMDTDGYIDERGAMSFCTISSRLRDDFIALVRSLGGCAFASEKHTTYEYGGERRNGKLAYTVSVRMRDASWCFSLPRKLERVPANYQYAESFFLGVESIEPDGFEECSCIMIDHPERCYITDGYTVTHNTTILDAFVGPLLGGTELQAQGNSTEAGIRQTLRADARPVLFDEAEQNDEREGQRVQAILALIRQSSSEGQTRTLKGTMSGRSMDFHVRSMFCLSSIQVGIQRQADHTRISILSLYGTSQVPPEQVPAHQAKWAATSRMLVELQQEEGFAGRLLARTVAMWPTIQANAQTLVRVAAEEFASQRLGDQYGTLLAGCAALLYDHEITEEGARRLIRSFDWGSYHEAAREDEAADALAAILQIRVRVPFDRGAPEDRTVGELLQIAITGRGAAGIEAGDASTHLGRIGIKVRRSGHVVQGVLVANKSRALSDELRGAPWAADWRSYLRRLPGADGHTLPVTFCPGLSSRATLLPTELFKFHDERQ